MSYIYYNVTLWHTVSAGNVAATGVGGVCLQPRVVLLIRAVLLDPLIIVGADAHVALSVNNAVLRMVHTFKPVTISKFY